MKNQNVDKFENFLPKTAKFWPEKPRKLTKIAFFDVKKLPKSSDKSISNENIWKEKKKVSATPSRAIRHLWEGPAIIIVYLFLNVFHIF